MAKEKPVVYDRGEEIPLGSRIRVLRQREGIRLTSLATKLGYDKGHLSNVERNKANPSDELIEKVATALNLTTEELMNAPLAQISRVPIVPAPRRGLGFALAAPRLPARQRTLGQRIERVVAAAHLSDEEKSILDERVVTMTSELIALLKAARRLGSGSAVSDSGER